MTETTISGKKFISTGAFTNISNLETGVCYLIILNLYSAKKIGLAAELIFLPGNS